MEMADHGRRFLDVETNVRIDPRLFRLNEDDDEEDERQQNRTALNGPVSSSPRTSPRPRELFSLNPKATAIACLLGSLTFTYQWYDGSTRNRVRRWQNVQD